MAVARGRHSDDVCDRARYGGSLRQPCHDPELIGAAQGRGRRRSSVSAAEVGSGGRYLLLVILIIMGIYLSFLFSTHFYLFVCFFIYAII